MVYFVVCGSVVEIHEMPIASAFSADIGLELLGVAGPIY